MPRPEAPRRFRHSLQRRFSLALAAFLVLSMILLGAAMLANQRQRMQERLARDTMDLTRSLLDKGNASCAFLARIAPQGLLSHDYLLLEGYVEEMSADPDIIYAVILDNAGTPVTHYLNAADDYFAGQAISPASYERILAQARNDETLIAVEREIEYEGGKLGRARVALSRAKIARRVAEFNTNLQRELRHIALLTGGLILMSLLALSLLIEGAFRRMVVKPIHLLSASMAQMQAGDLGARAAVLRDDQIGYLAERFNQMADELQSQLAETERHAHTVQETRDYLASILDHSADMIATTALDGTIVEFNDAAERILGYQRAEVVGHSSDVIYCDPDARDRLYATVMDGQTVQGAEIQLRRKDNTLVDIELTLSPLRDNQGELVGTVCIGRDVTHARALRRELIQSEKLASIGQVAAWIAHQIRNYLGRLLMSASALRPADDSAAPYRQAHADLTRTITEMERLVTDLLEYSRDMKLHPTTMNLNAMLEGLLDALASEQPPGKLTIERILQADLPPVQVDVFKLEQALSNVLHNAVQAMPDGGRLRVATHAGTKPGTAGVSIEDNGPGILAGDMSRIFRPFFTTRPGGTGLGLAMALRVIEAHGGTLTVQSSPGEGARFEFTLPNAPVTQAAS